MSQEKIRTQYEDEADLIKIRNFNKVIIKLCQFLNLSWDKERNKLIPKGTNSVDSNVLELIQNYYEIVGDCRKQLKNINNFGKNYIGSDTNLDLLQTKFNHLEKLSRLIIFKIIEVLFIEFFDKNKDFENLFRPEIAILSIYEKIPNLALDLKQLVLNIENIRKFKNYIFLILPPTTYSIEKTDMYISSYAHSLGNKFHRLKLVIDYINNSKNLPKLTSSFAQAYNKNFSINSADKCIAEFIKYELKQEGKVESEQYFLKMLEDIFSKLGFEENDENVIFFNNLIVSIFQRARNNFTEFEYWFNGLAALISIFDELITNQNKWGEDISNEIVKVYDNDKVCSLIITLSNSIKLNDQGNFSTNQGMELISKMVNEFNVHWKLFKISLKRDYSSYQSIVDTDNQNSTSHLSSGDYRTVLTFDLTNFSLTLPTQTPTLQAQDQTQIPL